MYTAEVMQHDDTDNTRIHLLFHLRSIHTGMIVIQQLLKESQPPCFEVLSSSEDLIHVLHVLGIVRVQLSQRRRVYTASRLHITSTSLHFLCQFLHLSCHQSTQTVLPVINTEECVTCNQHWGVSVLPVITQTVCYVASAFNKSFIHQSHAQRVNKEKTLETNQKISDLVCL